LTSSLLGVRRGSQVPRVSRFPAYPVSAAPEVVELAGRAGLVLDDWQRMVLEHGLGVEGSAWTAPKVSCWVPRQNGKGGIIEALELAWLFLLGEELIVHSAHEHKTANKAYKRLESLIRGVPWMHNRVRQYRQANGEQQIELKDGRLLQYTTRSATAVRGFSAPKVILDEAQELTAEQIGAIGPTVSAMANHQSWFFGTPPADPTAWAYGLRADGEAGVPRLAHFDWGAQLDLSDPLAVARAQWDRDLWFASNPALGIRISEDTVEDEARPSGLGEKFPMERLGVWLPRARQGGGPITADAWAALADPGSRRVGDVAFAIDVNPKRTHAAIAAWGRRADGRGHAELVAYQAGTGWVVDRVVALQERHSPVAWALDAKGPVGSLVQDLEAAGIKRPEAGVDPHRGALVVPTGSQFAAACGQLIDEVAAVGFAHPDQAHLNVAVENARTRPLGDAVAFGRRISTVDISPLVAVTLARWAFEGWRPPPPAESAYESRGLVTL
jgi:hypothetical protein